jgi:peroxiredoxin
MDNNRNLSEGLLKADGIDPKGAAESERIAFGIMLDKHSKSRQSKPGYRLDICKRIMKSKITKFAAAAAVSIAAIISINHFVGPIDATGVAWASIAEKFKSVPFLKATIYMKEDALDRPVQIEIWRNRRGRARLRYGSQIAFAEDGKVVRAFDLKTKSQTEPSDILVTILEKLWTDDFSLETVVRAISGGKLVDVTPLVNARASMSEDIVVFDIEHEGSPQWFRIWALRQSKLPTYIRMWDPRDGECVDVILTYSKEQQDAFFDPNAFSEEMKKPGNKEINLAYMFLEDPGGKQVLPRKLDEHQALKLVTKTIDGRDFSLGDYKGKTVLLAFWDNRYYHRELSWMKKIYKRFADRDDFVMVGVSLRKDAESSRKICKEKRIDWLQLHEPDAGYENSLAKALGVVDVRNLWLLWKDGKIEKLQDMPFEAGKLEASVIGFTYASEMWLNTKLQARQREYGVPSIEDIIEWCGDSYTIEDSPDVPGRKKMVYEAYNDDKSRIARFRVEIQDKTVLAWGSGTSLVDPATVTITFSSEFIKTRIESQVTTDILQKMYKDYEVMVSAVVSGKKSSLGYPFANNSIIPDESYQRQLPAGTYDFVINIGSANQYGSIIKIIKQIVLRKDIQLNKNENKTIRFE